MVRKRGAGSVTVKPFPVVVKACKHVVTFSIILVSISFQWLGVNLHTSAIPPYLHFVGSGSGGGGGSFGCSMFCARSTSSACILRSSSCPSGVMALLLASSFSSGVIESQSARTRASSSWVIKTWLNCVCGAAFVFRPKIRPDEVARSRNCDVLDTSRGFCRMPNYRPQ